MAADELDVVLEQIGRGAAVWTWAPAAKVGTREFLAELRSFPRALLAWVAGAALVVGTVFAPMHSRFECSGIGDCAAECLSFGVAALLDLTTLAMIWIALMVWGAVYEVSFRMSYSRIISPFRVEHGWSYWRAWVPASAAALAFFGAWQLLLQIAWLLPALGGRAEHWYLLFESERAAL